MLAIWSFLFLLSIQKEQIIIQCEGWILVNRFSTHGQRRRPSDINNDGKPHRLMPSPTKLSARKSFRRRVPYVEKKEEQQIRELWETNPFNTSKSVVSQVLDNGFSDKPLLKRLHETDLNPATQSSSGYEEFFDNLYKRPKVYGPSESNPYDKFRHFLFTVCYRGSDFCGWQRQPNNLSKPSIQQTLEDWLTPLDTRLPEGKSVNLRSCGRTDAGVNAIGQVCRFRTKDDLNSSIIAHHLDNLPHQGVRCTSVTEVSREFHPVFSATCRAYAYIIDVMPAEDENSKENNAYPSSSPILFDRLDVLNQILQELEGRDLCYTGLSYGRLNTVDGNCTLYHARACRVIRNNMDDAPALCIELVGNRFLRRMVRLLVEASLEIIYQSEEPTCDALLRHIQKEDRGLITFPAPPDGLMFVGAGFTPWK